MSYRCCIEDEILKLIWTKSWFIGEKIFLHFPLRFHSVVHGERTELARIYWGGMHSLASTKHQGGSFRYLLCCLSNMGGGRCVELGVKITRGRYMYQAFQLGQFSTLITQVTLKILLKGADCPFSLAEVTPRFAFTNETNSEKGKGSLTFILSSLALLNHQSKQNRCVIIYIIYAQKLM